MDDEPGPVTLRHSSAVWVPIVVWTFCVLALGDAIFEGSTGYVVRIACTVTSVAYIVYITLARPFLQVDTEGVTVANVLRTYRIPFGALTDIRVGGLTSVFARASGGRERRITSWNAPGVPRRLPRRESFASPPPGELRNAPRPMTSESEVERIIRNRWEEWRRSNPHGDGLDTISSSWNQREGIIALAVIVANIAIRFR